MATHSFWTDTRDAIIRKVADNGGTAAEAWKAVGAVSRNAVIGRAHRIGVIFGRNRLAPPAPVPLRLPSLPRPLPREDLAKIVTGKWTDSEIITMREMAEKRATFADVAETLGRSKNAVECKASDCEIKFFRHEVGRPPKPFGGGTRQGRALVFATGGKVALVDLQRHHCRYIPGDPRAGGPIYCGDRREPGSSFCPAHHLLCYMPAERRYVTPTSKLNTKVFVAARVLA